MKNTIIALIFAALVSLSAVPAAFAGTGGPAPVPPPPNFQVTTNTISLCKGVINHIPIEVKNQGGPTMQDVQVSVVNSKNVYTAGNGTISQVNVSSNSVQVIGVPIFVSLNASALVTAPIGINYQYDTLYSDSETRNISFGVETCPSQLLVSVNPPVLIAGKIQNISFNFTNTGSSELNGISVHASLPEADGTFLGIQPVSIGSLQPGLGYTLNQKVFVFKNASQSFPINLSISMYNGSSLEQINDNPVVLSSGIINITASSLTLSPQSPPAGSVFSISFILTDIGTAGASAVSATPLSVSGFEPYGANSVFVGDMQVDTQTPVTVTMQTLGSVKNGTYTIPIRISYLNNLRQNISTVVYAPVAISAAAGIPAGARVVRHGVSGVLIILFLVVISAAFAYLYYKERKKTRLHQQQKK